MAAVHAALTSSQAQVASLSTAIDSLRAESSNAVTELRALLATEQQRGQAFDARLGHERGGREPRPVTFVNVKVFDGGVFTGAKTENYRTWSKKAKIYCNALSRGFKKAMELAEGQATSVDVDALNLTGWTEAVEADQKLYDFLSTYTSGDAARIVDETPDRGFEAWRKLKKRFHPEGGTFELERTTRLMTSKQCKSLSELPSAMDVLEKGFRQYEITFGAPIPDPLKIGMLLKILPEAYRKELTLKFTLGERNFQKMADSIMGFSNDERIRDLGLYGQKDMDVDNLERARANEDYTEEEWAEYRTGLEAELEDLNYMGQRKGKGKGKGKKGKGKGQGGKAPSGSDAGRETRACHWCQKVGHLSADCRAKKAGKAKVAPTKGAASLEQDDADWQEDDLGSITDEPLESLEECVAMLMPVDEDQCQTCGDSECECSDGDDDDEDDWTDEAIEQPSSGSYGVTTPSRPSFLSQFGSPATASGFAAASPSVSTLIAEQQRAVQEHMAAILTPVKVKPQTSESAGVLGAIGVPADEPLGRNSTLQLATAVPPPSPPGMPAAPPAPHADVSTPRAPKKNRNKSSKAKVIKILAPKECGPECKCPAPESGTEQQAARAEEEIPVLPTFKLSTSVGTSMEDITAIEKLSIDTQTDLTLPHTMRDILWSAKGLDPIVDCEDMDDESVNDESVNDESVMDSEGTTAKFMEGPTVSDIDALDVDYAFDTVTLYRHGVRLGPSTIGNSYDVLTFLIYVSAVFIFIMAHIARPGPDDMQANGDDEDATSRGVGRPGGETDHPGLPGPPAVAALDGAICPPISGNRGCARRGNPSQILKLARISTVSERNFAHTGHVQGPGEGVDPEFELVESDNEEPPDLEPSDDEYEPEPVIPEPKPEVEEPHTTMDEWLDSLKNTKQGILSLAFFGEVEQLHGLPQVEPEYLEVEMTLDTGASVHAINRLDLPGFKVEESPGSRVGQRFQAAGGPLIPNEGQILLSMIAPGTNKELRCNVQVAAVTRPLLSVTKMTENGKLSVLCKKDVALILDENQNTLATFHRQGGLYVAMMKVKNPRFTPFARPGR